MRGLVICCLMLLSSAGRAGPIGKFEHKAPTLDYETATSRWDVERCLIDGDLAPFIYRQPDRPTEEVLIWTLPNGVALYRVDLSDVEKRTRVRSWSGLAFIQQCAPPIDLALPGRR